MHGSYTSSLGLCAEDDTSSVSLWLMSIMMNALLAGVLATSMYNSADDYHHPSGMRLRSEQFGHSLWRLLRST